MIPKFEQLGRAHGLPKIHKQFFKVTSFQLIVDTTNTPKILTKNLTNFLNLLTQKENTVQN